MSAAYSETPLIKKLGIIDEMKVMVINQPGNYFALLERNISAQFCKRNEAPDLIHLFVTNKKQFELEMEKISPKIKSTTAI